MTGSERKKRWRYRNPERSAESNRRTRLRREYGLELEDYERMLGEQGGVCKVCGKQETRMSVRGIIDPLAVDHDHVTGRVRGLLCSNCNTALGLVGEDEFRLIALADYILRARLDEEFAYNY